MRCGFEDISAVVSSPPSFLAWMCSYLSQEHAVLSSGGQPRHHPTFVLANMRAQSSYSLTQGLVPMATMSLATMSSTEAAFIALGLRSEDLFWRLSIESSLKDCDMSTVPSIIVAGAEEG